MDGERDIPKIMPRSLVQCSKDFAVLEKGLRHITTVICVSTFKSLGAHIASQVMFSRPVCINFSSSLIVPGIPSSAKFIFA
jgi:hypothetical protein